MANYPGVTVEEQRGRAAGRRGGGAHRPAGVYSLTPRSEDERVTRDVLRGNGGAPKPDAILLVLDSTNLGRHLVLAAPVLALGLPSLVVLNMADDSRRAADVDAAALAGQLGAPVALVSAARGEGVETIYEFLAASWASRAHRPARAADIPECRDWAVRVGGRAGYAAPAPPLWTRRLDAVFLHPSPGRSFSSRWWSRSSSRSSRPRAP